MAGLLEEGKKMMEEDAEAPVHGCGADRSAAQKVEHYEIASYGCVCTYAEMLGYDQVHELLGQNLDEEETTDQKLTALAEDVINPGSRGRRGGRRGGRARGMSLRLSPICSRNARGLSRVRSSGRWATTLPVDHHPGLLAAERDADSHQQDRGHDRQAEHQPPPETDRPPSRSGMPSSQLTGRPSSQ